MITGPDGGIWQFYTIVLRSGGRRIGMDRVQEFTIDGARLLFSQSGRGFGSRGGTAPVYQYRIEASKDGEHYTTVLDMSGNKVARNTIFDEIKPTACRYVRLVMLDWPKGSPLGILDFSVFGVPTRYLPSQVPVPTPLVMN